VSAANTVSGKYVTFHCYATTTIVLLLDAATNTCIISMFVMGCGSDAISPVSNASIHSGNNNKKTDNYDIKNDSGNGNTII